MPDKFILHSEFQPTGDQPQAIDKLVRGIEDGDRAQTLLGVTGSGKTFTMANVMARLNRPTLVLAHNKTLAAQLCSEFREFFPENAVEYFVSYYDYYQPEAYIPGKDQYIEKDALINEEIEKGSKILFEGAQGVMLCIDHGTYPYVTSSSPTASSVPQNTGIAPRYVDNVLGVCKAYTTRVGEGPFPTELEGVTADYIRERGHEYGTVTGRPRRVGWLDAVVLNHTRRVSGIDYLALMLFDVLSGLDTVKICVAYELDGKRIETMPPTIPQFQRCKPVYIELPGWKEDISGIKSFGELPQAAQDYVRKIEELTKIKVAVLSVGPDRLQTVRLCDIF